MERRLEAPLRKAILFLETKGYHYAIIGGVALAQWGVVRATFDIDIKILVPDIDYATVRDAIRITFPIPASQHVQQNPLIVAIDIDGVIVDFLLALPGYEENIITRAVQRDLGGWIARVCSSEDLIIQKVVAGRGKDWMDVESLLIEQYNRLDQVYIQGWLAQFAEALEEEALLSKYNELVEKVGKLF